MKSFLLILLRLFLIGFMRIAILKCKKDLISFKKYQNKKGIVSVRGKIGFRGPLLQKKNLPKIQLDLTASEILVLKPVKS